MKEREIAEKLKSFDSVWRRVRAAKSAREAASERGVRLMPGKKRKGGR